LVGHRTFTMTFVMEGYFSFVQVS